jgi:exopolysaccharide biosynthesis protein
MRAINMKNLSVFILFIFFIPVNLLSQDFTQIADGIEHAKFTRKIKDEPINVNLLRLDLTKVRLDVVHALDAAVGLETTSSIAARHGAIAAINAGFFKMTGVYNGDAAGILQIDGKLLSESYGNRIALGIINGKTKTEVNFGHIKSEIYFVRGVDETFGVAGINRQRGKDEIVLFTPEFHRTTLTDSNGFELIVKGSLVQEIRIDKGSSIIPTDGFVLSINGEKYAKLSQKPHIIRLRTKIESIENNKQSFFTKSEDIVAGVPQLIKNGKIEITWEQEKIGKEFVETRHPRTAVAKLKDGKFLLITVDGRQPNVSVGMNLNELAEMLLEFGAVEAMNLDGGGSTTMFVKDKVVNQTSDKTGERAVSDAILVTLRK